MICGNCGTQIDDDAVICPICGARFAENLQYSREDAFVDEKPLRSSGYAAAGLVLAMLATISCILPFVSIPLALIGLIMSILGLRSECRSMSIVALIINIVFLIFGTGVMIVALVFMKKYGFGMSHIFYFIENFFKNFLR